MAPAYLKGPKDVLPTIQIPYWCAGKESLQSAVLAFEVASRSRVERREVYFCRTCGSFHIGGSRRSHMEIK